MKEYEDPHKHLFQHIDRAARQYSEGLEKSGLKPNRTLTKAVAERALREAKDSYMQELQDTQAHNISVILDDHRERMNKIKRSGARFRLWTCPPIAALFFIMAIYSFDYDRSTGLIMGCIYLIGFLAFSLMLILGALFDRPSET